MRFLFKAADSDFMKRSLMAIGLALLAGLATAVGGCIVYFKSLVKLANKTFLSAALGFSAGVMLFLSFAEIFVESKEHFALVITNEHYAMLWACVSMFVGVFVAYLLEKLLHHSSKVEFELPVQDESAIARDVHGAHELPKVHAIHKNKRRDTEGDVVINPVVSDVAKQNLAANSPSQECLMVDMPKSGYEMKSISGNTRDLARENFFIDDKMREQLKTVGLLSAIAIALHNIPEGIVTYVGFMDDPFVGIPLAIGIACHNIPEGLSVALPVYYATKSRNKAFFWSLLSGFAEPLGALLCMFILQRFMNDYVFGFLFGFTGGIMTYICVCELIPTGMQMDCEKNYSMTAFLVGMGFIMISLILL